MSYQRQSLANLRSHELFPSVSFPVLSCGLSYFRVWEEVRNTCFCICISICSTLLVKKIIPSSLNCLYIFKKKIGGPHTCGSVGSIPGLLSRWSICCQYQVVLITAINLIFFQKSEKLVVALCSCLVKLFSCSTSLEFLLKFQIS